jgi:outer membrane protein
MIAVVAMAAALAAAPRPAAAQQPAQATGKFAIVNTQRIMRDSKLSQQTQKTLEAEVQKRLKEIEAGPKDQIERRKNALGEDMNARRQEALQKFIEKTNAIVRRVAETEKLDIVFFDAAYAHARIDITDKVIKELDSGR